MSSWNAETYVIRKKETNEQKQTKTNKRTDELGKNPERFPNP